MANKKIKHLIDRDGTEYDFEANGIKSTEFSSDGTLTITTDNGDTESYDGVKEAIDSINNDTIKADIDSKFKDVRDIELSKANTIDGDGRYLYGNASGWICPFEDYRDCFGLYVRSVLVRCPFEEKDSDNVTTAFRPDVVIATIDDSGKITEAELISKGYILGLRQTVKIYVNKQLDINQIILVHNSGFNSYSTEKLSHACIATTPNSQDDYTKLVGLTLGSYDLVCDMKLDIVGGTLIAGRNIKEVTNQNWYNLNCQVWSVPNGLELGHEPGYFRGVKVQTNVRSLPDAGSKIKVAIVTASKIEDTKKNVLDTVAVSSIDKMLVFDAPPASTAGGDKYVVSLPIDEYLDSNQLVMFYGEGCEKSEDAFIYCTSTTTDGYLNNDLMKSGNIDGTDTYRVNGKLQKLAGYVDAIQWRLYSESKFEHELRLVKTDYSDLKYVAFGDSITDEEITAEGVNVSSILGTKFIADWARGNATMSDYANHAISLEKQDNAVVNTNVISNQVLRMLQWTTPSGSQISWTHPIAGKQTIDTSYGTGLGNVDDIPDIIYIAAGTNDTKQDSMILDDTDEVFASDYANLTRKTVGSALRWAIETLLSAYPNAQVFVATPLHSKRDWTMTSLGNKRIWQVRDIIEKVCKYESVNMIDSFSKSGFNQITSYNNNDGIHPIGNWNIWIARFVANEIKNNLIDRSASENNYRPY